MILVDYRCGRCDGVSEHFVSTPVPATMDCPACRSPARRRFAAVGLSGRASPPVERRPARSARALCQDNPDIPGLCHMTPDAARAWVARARGDNRTLDRELERQERALRDNGGAVTDPVSHDHGHAHSGHAHSGHAHSGHAHSGHAAEPRAAVSHRNTITTPSGGNHE